LLLIGGPALEVEVVVVVVVVLKVAKFVEYERFHSVTELFYHPSV
jgi:hypothetical protein